MRYKRLFSLFVLFAFPSFAEYQQQGFSQFQTLDGNIHFVCAEQCFALMGPVEGADFVQLQGRLEGQGVIGYGFLVGEQVVSAHTINIDGVGHIDQQFSFDELPFYSQLPHDVQLVFLVQGNVSGRGFSLDRGYMTLFHKIGQGWKDFWKMETLTPYSINLRYGVKLLGTSIVEYGYRLFVLATLYILFFVKGDKEKKYRKIFFLGIGIFLFIGIRNLVTNIWIVHQGLTSYTYQSYDNKNYFDLGDYIVFTDKIRKTLQLDEGKKTCKIFVDSFQDWPFKSHRDMLYLKSCDIVLTGSEADYLVYYRKPVATGDMQKTVLLQFHGNYLLDNK